MERLNLRRAGGGGGVQRGIFFFCMSGENGSLLYTSQRDPGAGCGLVSSTQRGAFLSALPRGGAPAAASNTGQELDGRDGRRWGVEGGALGWKDALRFQERDMCWNPQVEAERPSQKKTFVLDFSPRGQMERKTLPAILGWSREIGQEGKSYDWRESTRAGDYQNKQHDVYRWANLPTETIFSIHLVGLSKHHVFAVYQTLSHPRSPEGGLNHLIYWILECADTQHPSTMQTENLATSSPWFNNHTAVQVSFLERFRLYTSYFLLNLLSFRVTQESKNHQISSDVKPTQNWLFCLYQIPFGWTNVQRGPQLSADGGWILH